MRRLKYTLENVYKIAINCIFGTPLPFHPSLRSIHSLRRFRTIYYIFPYSNRDVRTCMWQLKFRRNRDFAKELGALCADYLDEIVLELETMHAFDKPLLVSVPSSKDRIRTRGIDTNHLLCQSIINSSNFIQDHENTIIKKVKNTDPQSWSKTKRERMQKPIGAFTVTKPDQIAGRNIILFDDITTTGATIEHVSDLLKQAGARKILKFVIAH